LNKLHACILEHLPFEQAFQIISCLMRSFQSNIDTVSAFDFVSHIRRFKEAFLFKCTTESEQNDINLTSAWNCYNGTDSASGSELLKTHGDQTNTIDLSFVPSIEIDDVRKAEISNKLRKTFTRKLFLEFL
jgi:hypothetical protein